MVGLDDQNGLHAQNELDVRHDCGVAVIGGDDSEGGMLLYCLL